MDPKDCDNIGDAVKCIEEELKAAGIAEYKREALLMMAFALRIRPAEVMTMRDKPIADTHRLVLSGWIERRIRREPLQYILGEMEFWGMEIMVDRNVLIPRPETEELIEAALNAYGKLDIHDYDTLALDLCSGSGCIAIAIAKGIPRGRVLATDLSFMASEATIKNALINDVVERVECLTGDLFAPIAEAGLQGKLDLIVSNPPYIKSGDIATLEPEVRDHEPRSALDGGEDGLAFIRRIIVEAPTYLRDGGLLAMEIGYDQAEDVREIISKVEAFGEFEIKKDLAGIERILIARKIKKALPEKKLDKKSGKKAAKKRAKKKTAKKKIEDE
jgi:release factor glutamine methyltransferase